MSGNLPLHRVSWGIIRAILVIESRRTRGIAAIPDAGRKDDGAGGFGSCEDRRPVQRSAERSDSEDVAASRHGRSGTPTGWLQKLFRR